MSELTACDNYADILLSRSPLLDVRAPIEFSKGSFPNTSNIPLLSDNARHLVGIEYKNKGQEAAIALGAELLPPSDREQLVQSWLNFTNNNPDGYLYCFRGGLRSRISQEWLRDAGCEFPRVAGGYKAMRRFLIDSLQANCEAVPFYLIGGRTGTGKTLLLNTLKRAIDLEALAKHRGSSFGRMAVDQPSNIDFENSIAIELLRQVNDSSDIVYLEDEARMIGSAAIPTPLRDQMQNAPVAILETPIAERIAIGIDDYVVDLLQRFQLRDGETAGFEAFAEYHTSSLYRVRKRFGGDRYARAAELLETALKAHRNHNELHHYEPFIEMILTEYYDPMYDYQNRGKQDRIVFTGNAQAIKEWAASNALAVQ